MTNRQLFLSHVAQTSPAPIGLEIVKAEGIKMWDVDGKEYIDLISGFSVCNIGHSNPEVIKAVKDQVDRYMHLIVYGEFIETPQVAYAKLLTDYLPSSLNSVYFTNSGAEATEGAMKLAKRVTGRSKIIACNKAYHGSTQGALSVMGDEYWRNAFRPLLPDIYHLDYNSQELIDCIDNTTACVIVETVQAESGVNRPGEKWLKTLQTTCTEQGALLVFDEIQAGFGRTGSLWAFEHYGVVPDILLLGKALGGGMPLGAFIADISLMDSLTNNPVLGHITTFGGHPVSCAAGMAALKVLVEKNWIEEVKTKEELFLNCLKHDRIHSVRSAGLWLAVEFESFEVCKPIIDRCIEKGVVSDWFLFAPNCMRIAPPLIITEAEIKEICSVIMSSIEEVYQGK
ncbi:aspartate aminotransferase family protein [Segetibacter aerophilus]|uniref:Aspartate aminotransferase family protein n=1 Tax=Segetibacter aerophilus TaxID=670293 RepID=A0A512BFE4_9BACT|nr:aspartate aminotransferase family protein [Segetibacter aerophilus]GEO10557.1 aspartate aminotransferase family protein [Segetibacter aerophilus]